MNEQILIEELIKFMAGIECKMSRKELVYFNSIVSSYMLNYDQLINDRKAARVRLINSAYSTGYEQSVNDHGCQSFESVDKDWLNQVRGEYLSELNKSALTINYKKV